jgi:hypothetical protein
LIFQFERGVIFFDIGKNIDTLSKVFTILLMIPLERKRSKEAFRKKKQVPYSRVRSVGIERGG